MSLQLLHEKTGFEHTHSTGRQVWGITNCKIVPRYQLTKNHGTRGPLCSHDRVLEFALLTCSPPFPSGAEHWWAGSWLGSHPVFDWSISGASLSCLDWALFLDEHQHPSGRLCVPLFDPELFPSHEIQASNCSRSFQHWSTSQQMPIT